MPLDPRIVTRSDHERIQTQIGLKDGEDYSVIVKKGKGFWVKSVHVFERRPSTKEINDYEQKGGRVKFKGQKAELEGSQIMAARDLYNTLVARAYDVLVGVKKMDTLSREDAQKLVDPIEKREAIRELVAEVYSATRMSEQLGGEDEDDSDPEVRSSASADSGE